MLAIPTKIRSRLSGKRYKPGSKLNAGGKPVESPSFRDKLEFATHSHYLTTNSANIQTAAPEASMPRLAMVPSSQLLRSPAIPGRFSVKMTGMSGFGPTHTDDELWEIVALVKKLPGMSAAEYRGMTSLESG